MSVNELCWGYAITHLFLEGYGIQNWETEFRGHYFSVPYDMEELQTVVTEESKQEVEPSGTQIYT